MLRSIYSFFKKEPLYFWLLLALLAFYGFFFFRPRPQEPAPKPSQEINDFRQAEEKWNKDMEKEGAFRDFAKREPVLANLFQMMTIFFMLAFLAGAVIDILWIWKRDLFEKIRTDLSPPGNGTWPFSMLFKIVLLFMLWGLLLSFLMGVFHAFFPKAATDNHYMIVHTLSLNLICLYFMVKFVRSSGGNWRDLGLRMPAGGFFKEAGAGFLGYLGILPLFAVTVVILLLFATLIRYEPPPHPLVNVFLEEEKRAPLFMIGSVVLGAVIGPVFEEIFFRGFCYPILRNKWGKFWGMTLSAAFFAGIHHSGFVFWPVFILGIALAYLYDKRNSLIAPIVLHITHNTLFIAYFFLIKQIISR
ncbi:MAG TPA: CPBP family intramembrane metalloprotease [Candidatus Omnitrophota bacterium]|nr:CPBP family intramembrane metalloprotease [Candidatus Omnitrophota bacterium]